MKKMLLEMNLLPSPAVIEVEDRRKWFFAMPDLSCAETSLADEYVLKSLLHRLTGETELPVLLVGGRTVGTIQEVRYLNSKGELGRKIQAAGAVLDGLKKKKGRKH